MADRIDDIAGRIEVVEQKMDQLAVSVDQRFDQVDAALVEQRLYVEFAYERLDARLNRHDDHFHRIDGRFDRIDRRLDSIDSRFERIDQRFESMDQRFDGMAGQFTRLERKLDRFIDTQSRTNELVERRLKRLEPRAEA